MTEPLKQWGESRVEPGQRPDWTFRGVPMTTEHALEIADLAAAGEKTGTVMTRRAAVLLARRVRALDALVEWQPLGDDDD